jgi:hypothetical protein
MPAVCDLPALAYISFDRDGLVKSHEGDDLMGLTLGPTVGGWVVIANYAPDGLVDTGKPIELITH